MTPEIAAQLQKNQAEIDERNRRRGIQKADAQAELDAVVDSDADTATPDVDAELDAILEGNISDAEYELNEDDLYRGVDARRAERKKRELKDEVSRLSAEYRKHNLTIEELDTALTELHEQAYRQGDADRAEAARKQKRSKMPEPDDYGYLPDFTKHLREELETAYAMREEKLEKVYADSWDWLHREKESFTAQKKQFWDNRRAERRAQEQRRMQDMLVKEASTLYRKISQPTKDVHLPPELIKPASEIVMAIQLAVDDVPARLHKLAVKRANTRDVAEAKRIDKQIQNMKALWNKKSEQLLKLKQQYGLIVDANLYKREGSPYYPTITKLDDAIEMIGERKISDLDISEMRRVLEAVRSVAHTAAQANTFISKSYDGQEIHAFGLGLEKETKSNKLFGGKWWHNFKGNLLAAQLGVTRFFDMMGGYTKNSQWSTVGDSFLEAQKNYLTKHRDFIRHFSEITNSPEFKQLNSIGKKGKLYDVGLRDADGQSVPLTRDLMLSLYQHLTKPANRQAFIDGGVEVPDAELYAKGDIEKAIKNATRLTRSAYYEKIHDVLHQIEQNTDNLAEHNRLTGELLRLEEQANAEVEEIVKNIEGQLTEFDKKYLAAVDSWFDGKAQKMLNDTTMTVYGFNKAIVEHYYPIYRDKNFVNRDFDSLVMDATLDNMGSMKTRVKSTAPLQLVGMTDVVTRSARETLQFAAYLPVMTDMRRLLNVRSQDGNVSLRDTIDKMADKSALGTTPMEYIENLMADLAGARKSNENGWFMTLRRNAIRATMTFNMRVAAKQTGALFSSASELGWPYMSKALLKKKVDPKTVAEYSVYFFERYYGDGGVEEYVEMRRGHHLTDRLYNKLDEVTRGKWLNWCADMDNFVCNVLWNSCEAKIADTRKDLTRGSEEFNRAVGELLDTVIAKTQSNYTLMERSDAQRDPSAHMKILTLYKTDALQSFGVLYESIHRVRKYSADLKAGVNGVTEADVKAAKEKLASSIPAVIVGSAIWPAIIGMLVNMLLNRTGNYRDEDNALTVGSVTRALTSETLGGLAGMVMLGDQLYDAAASVIFGEKYYGLSDTGVESFTGALESIGTIKSLIEGWANENTFDVKKLGYVVADMGSVMGLPLKNAWDMGKGVIDHWRDIKSGKFLSFEAGAEISATQYFNQLYTAISRGKDEKAQELREYLLACGKTEEEITAGLRAAVKRKDEDFEARYKEAIAEAQRDMFYRQLTAEEQKKAQSGIKGYIADSILADKTGSELTKTNAKAAESIDTGRVSTAQYFSVKTARNAEFVDKDGDGEVSKTERRQVLNTMEVDAYLRKLFL